MAVSRRQRALAETNGIPWCGDPNQSAVGHHRKDRGRWCRGKKGVEHRWLTGRLRNVPWSDELCGWQARHRRDRATGKSVVVDERWYWRCHEQEYCGGCGKIKRTTLDADCTELADLPPDDRPTRFSFL